MHSDHDLDLISALAEGRLREPGPAEDLIASCPECEALYRAHLTVREAVEAESRPRLDDLERRRLHSALWEVVEPKPVPTARPTPWWYRIAPVAAALVVVVGVVAIITSGNMGEDAALDTAARTMTADDQAGADGATEMAPFSDAPESTGAPQKGEAGPTATTAAAADPTEAPEPESSDYTRDELPDALDRFRTRVADREETAPGEAFECEAPSEAGRLLAVESATVDGAPVWFVAYGRPGEVDQVVAFRQSDCEILLRDG